MNRLLLVAMLAAMGLACGGSNQSPPDNSGGSSNDASAGAGGGGGSAMVDGSAGTGGSSSGTDGGFNLDAIALPDGPIGACAGCIRDMCQQELSTCLADPKCQMGLICTIQKCGQYASGDAGAAGLACLIGCFGDLPTALGALNGVTCVTTKCNACAALLDSGATDSGIATDSGATDTTPIDTGVGD